MKNIFAILLMVISFNIHAKVVSSVDTLIPEISDTILLPTQELVTVLAVHDGDSYKVRRASGDIIWIRLWGIDCPEVKSNRIIANQDYGVETGNFVRELIKGKQVLIDTLPGRDRYKRLVARVQLDTIYMTQYLIQNGYGWVLKLQMSDDAYRYLRQLQEEADSFNRGLWGITGRKIRPKTFFAKYSTF
jgi:endonuclease YncB( thermonuclease family)